MTYRSELTFVLTGFWGTFQIELSDESVVEFELITTELEEEIGEFYSILEQVQKDIHLLMKEKLNMSDFQINYRKGWKVAQNLSFYLFLLEQSLETQKDEEEEGVKEEVKDEIKEKENRFSWEKDADKLAHIWSKGVPKSAPASPPTPIVQPLAARPSQNNCATITAAAITPPRVVKHRLFVPIAFGLMPFPTPASQTHTSKFANIWKPSSSACVNNNFPDWWQIPSPFLPFIVYFKTAACEISFAMSP